MAAPQIGIYIHIPYCLQKCPYCDFAKYEVGEIPPSTEYTTLLQKEISVKAKSIKNKNVKTLYFGGGTPSLMTTQDLREILNTLKSVFDLSSLEEFTVECNPGTLDQQKLEEFSQLGVNRWSVGAQTFQPEILNQLGRKHSVQETIDTLNLLNKNKVLFTLDLMYALPNQSIDIFKADIAQALQFQPKHVSLYYLTLPDFHDLNKNRPSEPEQIEMFDSLEEELKKAGLLRYEISNFAVPGYESKHNSGYWNLNGYVGFGLSSHSYLAPEKQYPFGARFWNSRTYRKYESYVLSLKELSEPFGALPLNQIEILKENEALTDFFHVFLRKMSGFSLNKLIELFPKNGALAVTRLEQLTSEDLLEKSLAPEINYKLSARGKKLTNLVFEKLTFLESEINI